MTPEFEAALRKRVVTVRDILDGVKTMPAAASAEELLILSHGVDMALDEVDRLRAENRKLVEACRAARSDIVHGWTSEARAKLSAAIEGGSG